MENRSAPRLRAELETHVESGAERHDAVILDLSQTGCFLLTRAEFVVGAAVKVEVGKPGLLHMTLDGLVVHRQGSRGLGIRFRGVSATQQTLLTKLMQFIAQSSHLTTSNVG